MALLAFWLPAVADACCPKAPLYTDEGLKREKRVSPVPNSPHLTATFRNIVHTKVLRESSVSSPLGRHEMLTKSNVSNSCTVSFSFSYKSYLPLAT